MAANLEEFEKKQVFFSFVSCEYCYFVIYCIEENLSKKKRF